MNKQNNSYIPLIIAASVIVGVLLGTLFARRVSSGRLSIVNSSSGKLSELLTEIDAKYVDTVNVSDLVDKAITTVLGQLDPHSQYIKAADVRMANEDLHGSFSGIGIQFTTRSDTVYVSGIIKGGPSEKVGILAGDRIIAIDDSAYVGEVVNNEETMRRLKGPKGTSVKLTVLRRNEKKDFIVERGDIPVKSVDASYMLTRSLGYVRVKSFGENTYKEMMIALAKLSANNCKGLVIDLRGNGGGYLGTAIQMVNEFLPGNQLIVYTEGRNSPRQDYYSDGSGSWPDLPLIVLTDESTASAAEIFSGAIQDNDRGMVVGRRTFGKGLVQESIDLEDGSVVHLTVARYYTPSGRCIQKPYVSGDATDYDLDIITRYNHGEFFNQDSIRQTGEAYQTSIGRTVYGGGGIMPDVFVPEDTTLFTPYYQECASKGYLAEFCFEYTDKHREELAPYTTTEKLLTYLKSQHLVEQFVRYADQKGLARRNNQIIKSQPLFQEFIYGSIIYNMLDTEASLQFLNMNDPAIRKAMQLFNSNQTKPTVQDTDEKKTACGRSSSVTQSRFSTHLA